jgi:lactaldehyde dehydrogenase
LVRAKGVDLVTMTGSTEAGRQILKDAADTLKKAHLELGGNDATIVCADADIKSAAADLISGRFTSGNGQICCAVKRVLADRSIADELVAEVVSRTRTLKVGDPLDDETDVGPLISERAARRVEQQVDGAVRDGAKILAGGVRRGAFYDPTVLSGVRPGMDAFSEEIFGPVLPILPFTTFDEALDLANDSPYGLQAAIYTHDVRRIMQAFRTLEVGTVIANHSTAIRVENLPFGGAKMSGNTREGVHETLLDMTEQRTLLLNNVFGGA